MKETWTRDHSFSGHSLDGKSELSNWFSALDWEDLILLSLNELELVDPIRPLRVFSYILSKNLREFAQSKSQNNKISIKATSKARNNPEFLENDFMIWQVTHFTQLELYFVSLLMWLDMPLL